MTNAASDAGDGLITVGHRLRSVVCDTEIIVVRAPAGPVALSCGGQRMVSLDSSASVATARDPGVEAQAQLGKRYVNEALGLEVLVTKSGAGPLEADGVALEIKPAKALPSSD